MTPLSPRLLLGAVVAALVVAGTFFLQSRARDQGRALAEAACAARLDGARARFEQTLSAMEAAREAVPVPDPDTVLDRLRRGAFAREPRSAP